MRRRVIEWSDPKETLAFAVESSGLDYLRAIESGAVPPPPMALLMNMAIDKVERGHIAFVGTPGEEHYNPHGTVHGGYMATLFDTALGCAVHSVLERGFGYTTLELHVNFVRPVTRESGRLRCDATIVHEGKRVATAEAKLYDQRDKLYGHATTTCLIFERP